MIQMMINLALRVVSLPSEILINSRTHIALLSSLLMLTGCNVMDSQAPQSESDGVNGKDLLFVHQGVDRTYKIFRPENLPDNAPMLFALHGLGGQSEDMYRIGFNELAKQHGFLAVFPQSLRKTVILNREQAKMAGLDLDEFCQSNKSSDDWMKYVCVDGKLVSTAGNVRWNDTSTANGEDDVGFLSELAVYLQDRYQLNPEKTFVTGMSNGAYMSYTLICQAGGIFNGAAPVAGLSEHSIFNNCAPQGPKPLLHIHGVDDQLVPITGKRSKGGKKSSVSSAEELVEYFANLNNYAKKKTMKATQNATLYKYLPDDDGVEVHYYRIENYGHEWPSSPNRNKPGEKDASGFFATEVIWDFFSKY